MDDSPTPQRPARTHRMGMRVLYRRFERETQAGPIVEFAIIVPVLLLLLLGIVDIGFAYFRMNSLVAAVREGARFAAVQGNPCLGTTQTAVKTRVMSYFNPGVNKVADQLTTSKITVVVACPDPLVISVQVPAYTYNPINPAFRLINQTGIFNFRPVAAEFRWERSP